MAEKIEPNAPLPPQHRKHIADAQGNFHPVPEVTTPAKTEAEPTPEVRPFAVGDLVVISGRITDMQSTQAGQHSIQVQMPSGSAWYQSGHLQHAEDTELGRRVKELEALTAEQTRLLTIERAEKAELQKRLQSAPKAQASPAKQKAMPAPPENKALLKAPENKGS